MREREPRGRVRRALSLALSLALAMQLLGVQAPAALAEALEGEPAVEATEAGAGGQQGGEGQPGVEGGAPAEQPTAPDGGADALDVVEVPGDAQALEEGELEEEDTEAPVDTQAPEVDPSEALQTQDGGTGGTDAPENLTKGAYKVAFDANGGGGAMDDQSFGSGEEKPLTANAFEREGYTFDGWNTLATPTPTEPGTPYADRQAVKDLGSEDAPTVTLYAQWKPITYSVTFDANDGEGTMSDQSFVYDAVQSLAKNAFSREGYRFVGWKWGDNTYTDEQEVKNLAATDGAKLTFTAQWKKVEIQNYAALSEDGKTLTFKWGDSGSEPQGTKVYTGYDTAEYHYRDDAPWYNDRQGITTVAFDVSLVEGDVRHLAPKSICCWFSGFSDLTDVEGLQRLDTSQVNNMAWLFNDCSSLKSIDLSNLDTSNCASIHGVFEECSGLESVDVSGWDLSNCRRMDDVFYGCSSLTALDVSSWDTSHMGNTSRAFQGCGGLGYLDLSNFVCSAVTGTQHMFTDCSSLEEVDLGKDFSFRDVNSTNTNLLPTPAGADYTGSWYYLAKAEGASDDVPVGTVKQAAELCDEFDGSSMAGTWVWERTDGDYSKYGRRGVTYDANGGEGQVTTQFVHRTKPDVRLSDGVGMSLEGHTISGWNTEGDGSGDAYDLGSTITLEGDLKLYAQWAANSYTVAFEKNAADATGAMESQAFTYGEAQALRANAFEYAGRHLAGWSTQADGGGDTYADEQEVENLTAEAGGSITLYAQWELNEYTVTFDPAGGELNDAQREQQVRHGDKAEMPAGARRKGYVLSGWFAEGAEEAYDFGAPVTGDLALTARWDALGPVDYVDEGGEPQTRAADGYEALTADAGGQTLPAGWYAVLADVSLDERVGIEGEVHLILCDGATLTASQGVNLTPGNELWVYGQQGQSGALEATAPDFAAGIGGGVYEDGGDFVLAGGKVVAKGGRSAAGVGGGAATTGMEYVRPCFRSAGGNVTVYNGELEARGGVDAAGIGSGYGSYESTVDGGTFTIFDGTVRAFGGKGGAGIGSGRSGGESGRPRSKSHGITFKALGGTVEAHGGDTGAGIGCGGCYYSKGEAGVVEVSGDAKVFAYGGYSAAGIGTGQDDGVGAEVTVSGGEVTAVGGNAGAGIGGGDISPWTESYGSGGKLTVTGGEVNATGGSGGAGIGGGSRCDGADVVISGGNVTAVGGHNGSGIGTGRDTKVPGSLEMSGGKLVARAGYGAAGIGCGACLSSNLESPIKVTITGGEVWAYGECDGAAIGGGEYAPGGTVIITGGKVVADGRAYNVDGTEKIGGAGIGSGYSCDSGGTVLIEGDADVTAIGGMEAAGIGGTVYGPGADVTIRATEAGAPTVLARGGEYGAGIGGAWMNTSAPKPSGSLTVEGPANVTAIGGIRAAGIGGGIYGPGANVTISGGAIVTAQAGRPYNEQSVTQAIGYGQRLKSEANPADSGELTIYPLAKVMRGEQEDGVGATASLAAERVDDCRAFLWAQVSPCDHEGATYTPTDDNLHHTIVCAHCAGDKDSEGKLVEHDHEFVEGADGAVCACGVHAYRVSFDANATDATGAMRASDLIVEGYGYNVPECGFARTGYDFVDWNTAADGSGTGYADMATVSPVEANVTLYAQWTAHRYKVAFDKNAADATGSMGDQELTYDAVPTSEAEPGTPYSDGQPVKNLTAEGNATVTLYAQWTAHRYKVAFDKNAEDATGTMAEQELIYDAAATALTANGFSRTGYAFAGWNTAADGSGDAYDDGAEVRNLATGSGATVTLHAQWEQKTYTVSFDPNGAEMDEGQREQQVKHGEKARRPAGARRQGYVLAGWLADGSQEPYDFDAPVTGDLALKARWDALGPVDYVDEGGEPQTRAAGGYEAPWASRARCTSSCATAPRSPRAGASTSRPGTSCGCTASRASPARSWLPGPTTRPGSAAACTRTAATSCSRAAGSPPRAESTAPA